jgi:hypothetical protein
MMLGERIMLGPHLQLAMDPGLPTSDADRIALQRHLTALLMDLRENPTRLPELKNRCLAITDHLALTEAKLYRVPAIRKGGLISKLL